MRLSVPLSLTIGAVVLAAAAACSNPPPPPPPAPAVDSAAIRDSIARAEAARRAREDSIARARAEAERLAAERRAAEEAARMTERVRGMLMELINFDYDKSNIRAGDAAILDRKIAILQANPMVAVTITGHCDERGSDEYNLALGNRRALAAKEYMVNRGIAADRIGTASRGEEEPIDPAKGEEAWAKNRRDAFAITAGGQMLKAPAGM
jgi:peptidoglycan-associated lipoprotein